VASAEHGEYAAAASELETLPSGVEAEPTTQDVAVRIQQGIAVAAGAEPETIVGHDVRERVVTGVQFECRCSVSYSGHDDHCRSDP
jgi:hypothetical protein